MGDRHNKKPSRKTRGKNPNENNHNQDDSQEPSNVVRNLLPELEEAYQLDQLQFISNIIPFILQTIIFYGLSNEISNGKINPLILKALLSTYNKNPNTTESSQIHNHPEKTLEEETDSHDNDNTTLYEMSLDDLMLSRRLSRKSMLLSQSRSISSYEIQRHNDNSQQEHTILSEPSRGEELTPPEAPIVEFLENGDAVINGLVVSDEDMHTPQTTPRRSTSPNTPQAPIKKPQNSQDSVSGYSSDPREEDSDSECYLDQEEADMNTPQTTPRRPASPSIPQAPIKKPQNNQDSESDYSSDPREEDSDSEYHLDPEEADIDTTPDASPIAPQNSPEAFLSTQRAFYEDAVTPLAEPARDLFGDDSETEIDEEQRPHEGRDLFGDDYSDDDLPGSSHDYE